MIGLFTIPNIIYRAPKSPFCLPVTTSVFLLATPFKIIKKKSFFKLSIPRGYVSTSMQPASSELSLVSPDKGSPFTEHSDSKALPLPLVDPHLLRGVQTCQHCSPLPRYLLRIHVLEHAHTQQCATIRLQCVVIFAPVSLEHIVHATT